MKRLAALFSSLALFLLVFALTLYGLSLFRMDTQLKVVTTQLNKVSNKQMTDESSLKKLYITPSVTPKPSIILRKR